MNNIHRVLGDVPGVPGNFMDGLSIFVCALLKGSLGRYEQHRTVHF